MNPKIIAETDRLILRRFEDIDLMDLYAYLSDPEVVKFEPYVAMTLDQVKENLQWRISTPEMVAVQLKSDARLIGNVYLGQREHQTLELGFVFNRAYWGKGYAKEACAALINQAFQNGVHRIIAECDPENTSSWRLLETLGLTREAHLKQNVFFFRDAFGKPIWKDTFVYSKLKEQ